MELEFIIIAAVFTAGTVYLYMRKRNLSSDFTNIAMCGHEATEEIAFTKFNETFHFKQVKKKGKYDFCTNCWESKVICCSVCGEVIHFDEYVCLISSPINFDETKGARCYSKKSGAYIACGKHTDSFFDIQGAWTQNGLNKLFKIFGAPQGKNTFWKWKEVGFTPVESEEYKNYKRNKNCHTKSMSIVSISSNKNK